MSESDDSSRFGRYALAARWYDVLSMEPVLYRGGRLAAIEALDLQPGQRVVDLGTGTGLSLPALARAVGDDGEVVGLDPSPEMLTRARARIDGHAWAGRVRLMTGSAAAPPPQVDGPFDAALFAYALGVMDDWQQAWKATICRVRPGGRIAVLDTDWPDGKWKILAPAAAGMLAAGGVHPDREVWSYAADRLEDPVTHSLKGGHVRYTVGTVPDRPS